MCSGQLMPVLHVAWNCQEKPNKKEN